MATANREAPNTCLIVISRGGAELAQTLAPTLPGQVVLRVADRYAELVTASPSMSVEPFPLPLRPVIADEFGRQSRMVLFMPVGAAVRLLAPLMQHKHDDPAVVCVDDAGRFAVSLLSGHVGGADELAEQVATALHAIPVVTSASHVKKTLAVDLLGRKYGWQCVAEPATVTRVSAAVVNGEAVGILQEAGERDWWPADTPLPENVTVYGTPKELLGSSCAAALIISDRDPVIDDSGTADADNTGLTPNVVVYRPRTLVVGMGCRRGVARQHLENLLQSSLEANDLSQACIKCIATADIKGDEPGLLELAERMGVPLVCFGADELNSVFSSLSDGQERRPGEQARNLPDLGPTPSETARRLVGVWGVSEPSALLASGAEQLLVKRHKSDRATVAIARIPFPT